MTQIGAGPRCAGEGCMEQPQAGGRHCILHDPDPDKDQRRFLEALELKLLRDHNDPALDRVDLSSLQVPCPLSWSTLWGPEPFTKSLDLMEALFRGDADFSEAHFQRRVDLSSTRFQGAADFAEARFQAEALFPGVRFRQDADFSRVDFPGPVDFSLARFGGVAAFPSAQFQGRADFSSAQFGQDANFSGVWFQDDADFSLARFYQVADFSNARFQANAFFPKARFHRDVHFVSTRFPRTRGVVDLHQLFLQDPARVSFEDVDLHRASLLRTDVSRVRFLGVRWPRARGRPLLFDETRLSAAPSDGAKIDRLLVEELYGRLRTGYEMAHRETEARGFFIAQMETRRRDTATYPWRHRLLLTLYRWIALYGESYLRPLALYLLLSLLFPIAYLAAGMDSLEGVYPLGLRQPLDTAHLLADYARAWVVTVTAGNLLRDLPTFQSAWGPPILTLNTLLFLGLLALFIVALRRRFKR